MKNIYHQGQALDVTLKKKFLTFTVSPAGTEQKDGKTFLISRTTLYSTEFGNPGLQIK